MHRLTYAVLELVRVSRAGAGSSRNGRERALYGAMELLARGGGPFDRLRDPGNLKTKHLEYVVYAAIERGLSQGSVRNLLGHLRFLERAIGKRGLLKDNAYYTGIPEARHRPEGRGVLPDIAKWDSMPENTIEARAAKASAGLSILTGVRLKTTVKVNPLRTEEGLLQVVGGDAKGSRPCVVNYKAFMEAHGLQRLDVFIRKVGAEMNTGTMIPPGQNEKQQKDRVRNCMRKAGLANPHAYRHNWARDEYNRKVAERAHAAGIPAWYCPVRGGPKANTLTGEAKNIDRDVRNEVSASLGHGRIEIMRAYIG